MTASTPFSIAETTPQDTDVASAFPATERTYRDVVETWLLAISTVYGYTRVPALTTTQRNSETNWAVGNMIYNTTLARLQAVTAIGPVTWADALGPNDNFPSGTRMLFQQTSAPTGWTKESGAAYENITFMGTTGGVGTGGAATFTAVFTSRTPTGTNAASSLAGTPTVSVPKDGYSVGGTSTGAGQLAASATGGLGPAAGYAWINADRSLNVSLSGVTALGQTFTGDAMDFNIKYAQVIVAQKA